MTPERHAALWSGAPLIALCLLTGLLGLGNHGLWNPDEPRDVGVGYEMWRTQDWLVAHLSGMPFLEKPPLYWWVQATVFSLIGAGVAQARLASALFGFGTLAMTHLLGRRYFSREACTLAVLLLLTTKIFANHSHTASLDPALLFSATSAVACFAHGEPARGTPRRAWLAGMDASLAAGFFSKGLLGVGLPLLGIGCYLLWVGRVRAFLAPLLVATLAVAALSGTWLWAVHRELGPAALGEFLIQNQLERLLPQLADHAVGHQRPLYYYALKAPRDFLPWWPLAPLAVVAARRGWSGLAVREREGLQLLLSLLLPALLLLSIAGTKRAVYLLPLAAPMALLVGWGIAAEVPRLAWEVRLDRLWRRAALLTAALVPALLAAFGASPLWLGASLALGVLGWLSERAEHAPGKRWLRALTLVTLAWACFLAGAFPLLDRTRSLEPAARELERALPLGTEIHALSPSESLRGIATFYLYRHLRIVHDPARLPELVATRRLAWVVIDSEGVKNAALGALQSASIPWTLLHTRRETPARFWLVAIGSGAEDLAQRPPSASTSPNFASPGSSGQRGRANSSAAATSIFSSGVMRE